MPNFDATGPLGYGSDTGRGLGPCGSGMAWRKGFGRGYGRGFGRRFFTKKEETDILKEEADILEEELKGVKERLDELKKTK